MKKLIPLSILALSIMLIPITRVIASDISGALYNGTIRVTNSSYTASDVSTPFTLNTQALIDGYYMESDGSNSAIRSPSGADVPYMPAVDTGDDWIVFIDQITQNSSLNYYLYTGGDDMEGTIRYFPDTDGMTTSDSAGLELGNSFEVEQSGYIDTTTGSDKNLAYKEDAFVLNISGEEEISASIYGTTTTVNLVPDGAGDYTNINSQQPSSTYHWDKVDDTPGAPDESSTYIYTTNNTPTPQKDAYTLSSSGIPSDSIINNVTVYFRIRTNLKAGTAYCTPYLRLGTDETTGTQRTEGDADWTTFNEVLSRPGGGDWQYSDLEDLQVVVGLRTTSEYQSWCTQVYVVVNYTPVITVTASSIESGDHVVKVTAGGTDLKIYIDDVEEDSAALSGVSVIDNSNDWSFLQNGSMTYMEYHKITVSGSLKQHIEWENSTTFTDLSGNSNSATPTFRTTSSDADVSATILSFGAIEQSEMTGYESGEAPEVFTEVPVVDSMHEELNVSNLPGADFFNEMLDNAGVPRSLFWFPIIFGQAIIAGMVVYYFAKDALIMSVTSGAVLIFFAAMGAVPLWTLIPYIAVIMAVLAARKTVSL